MQQTGYSKLSQADAAAFDKYTHRVRELNIFDAKSAQQIGDLCLLRHTALFPNLRELVWVFSQDTLAIIPLLQPSIKKIELVYPLEDGIGSEVPSPQSHVMALRLLPSHIPNLESLTTTNNSWRLCSETLSESLLHLHHLRELCCDRDLEVRTLKFLSKLPTLRELRFDAVSQNDFPPLSPGGFPALENFHMGDIIPNVMQVIDSISSPYIKKCTVDFLDATDDFTPLITLITSRWSSTLTSFSLASYNAEDPPCVFPMTALELLYTCRQLKTFEVQHDLILELNDSDVDAIASAWPKLQILLIYPQMPRPPKVTLPALRRLVQKCPQLDWLTIPIDASTTPPLAPSLLSNDQDTNRVSVLRLEKSICGDAKCVSQFIRRAFPSLHSLSVGAWQADSEEQLRAWTDTADTVKRMYKDPIIAQLATNRYLFAEDEDEDEDEDHDEDEEDEDDEDQDVWDGPYY